MILPDVNLLVYAYNSAATQHEASRAWWEACLSERQDVALPWVVALGYVRIMSSRHVLVRPLEAEAALGHVRSWLERPQVGLLQPGPRHLDLLDQLMTAGSASGRLTTDAHLAALAIEHQAELHSSDADFSRFPGLRWHNPLG
jgi:toxin-antitoxin system PIN domain toxin